MRRMMLFLLMAGICFGLRDRPYFGPIAQEITTAIKTNDQYAFGMMLRVAAADAQVWEKNSADYVCDGVDDDVEINAAFARLAVGSAGNIKGGVCLTSGNFYIGDTIHLYRAIANKSCDLVLLGQGMNATKIYLQNDSNCNMIDCVLPSGGTTSTGFISVRDLVISGNSANQTSGHGLFVDDASTTGNNFDANIDHVMAISCKEDGFHLRGTWGYKITNCITEICNNDGLHFEYATAGNVPTQNYVSNHFSAYNSRYGIYIKGQETLLNNLHIYKNGNDGIYVWGNFNLFSNFVVSQYGNNGRGNTQANSAGIELNYANNCVLTNFLIIGQDTSNSGDGMYISGNHNTISNGRITGHYVDPIDYNPAAFGNVISNIKASWGNGGEMFDYAVIGNVFDNVWMFQDAVGTTTVLRPQGFINLNTTTQAMAATLGDGAKDGDIVRIVLHVKGTDNNAVITISKHATSSPEVATFSTQYEYLILRWDATNDYWVTVASTCAF